MMTHKHIQQMFSEESDDDWILGFWINIANFIFSASYTRVRLQGGFWVLKTVGSYMFNFYFRVRIDRMNFDENIRDQLISIVMKKD